MYGFVWNQVTGGQDIPKEQRGELNQRKLAIILYLYKKEGTLDKKDMDVIKQIEKKLGIVAGKIMAKGTSQLNLCLKLLKYNQLSSMVWKELAGGKKVN